VGSIPTRSRHAPDRVKRAFVIINPTAGRGRGTRLGHAIAEVFRDRGWVTHVCETRTPGEERDLAEAGARAGWPLVVAAGGDGTVHGVANGLLRSGVAGTSLGVLGIGTGNDFARLVGAPSHVERGVIALEHGAPRAMDVGRVGDEYFINGFGVGFDTAVLTEMTRLPALRGSALYAAAVYRAFLRFRAPTISVETAERRATGPTMLTEVAIGRTAGGGFRLTPQADPADGLFDVCMIRQVGLWTFLRYMPRVIRGTHASLPPVTMFQTAAVRIATPGLPLVAHLDGEVRRYGADAVELRVVPGALLVRCTT
jgi:diacylglycerol kinase (ATP)